MGDYSYIMVYDCLDNKALYILNQLNNDMIVFTT